MKTNFLQGMKLLSPTQPNPTLTHVGWVGLVSTHVMSWVELKKLFNQTQPMYTLKPILAIANHKVVTYSEKCFPKQYILNKLA